MKILNFTVIRQTENEILTKKKKMSFALFKIYKVIEYDVNDAGTLTSSIPLVIKAVCRVYGNK